MKQLDTEEARGRYDNIVIDTADLAYDAAEAQVCSVHGVDNIGKPSNIADIKSL